MKNLFISLLILVTFSSCTHRDDDTFDHQEWNGVYYWKTVLDINREESHFLNRHKVGRMYLRMFDVTAEQNNSPFVFEKVMPNASIQIERYKNEETEDALKAMIVPVVYITLDALKAYNGKEGQLAERIVERVRRMCKYHNLVNLEGLQLDCDWTATTEKSFFLLCDSAKIHISQKNLKWVLSSTIRLHQLARKAPPVDYGVLMVYNTGSFDDPDAKNSIISLKDVEPYLQHLDDFPLHLDVAYPTYSWQLLFRDRRFMGLLSDIDLSDSTRYAQIEVNKHRALCDIMHKDKIIRKGDIIRTEASSISEVLAVKGAIERHLAGRPHCNIIYHLDSTNLSKYTANEIDKLYSIDRRD
ncbi:MAG: hypothetical protein ACI4AK_05180 [Lepagella sp.]